MAAASSLMLFAVLINTALWALFLYVIFLVIRALRKYIRSAPAREESKIVRGTLSERLRENRMRCNMTQEFVAEAVGVSRQAVSKWENGASDPSTVNLLALAKLYGVSVEDLLKGI